MNSFGVQLVCVVAPWAAVFSLAFASVWFGWRKVSVRPNSPVIEWAARLRSARNRRMAETFVAPMRETLALFGFQVGDRDDPETARAIQEAIDLAGAGVAREVAQVLRGTIASGRATIFETWRVDGASDIDTIAVLETDSAPRAETAVIEASGAAVADTEAGGHATLWTLAAMVGMPVGTRVQIAPGRIVVAYPARIAPSLLSELLRRLQAIEAGLPRRPEPAFERAARRHAQLAAVR